MIILKEKLLSMAISNVVNSFLVDMVILEHNYLTCPIIFIYTTRSAKFLADLQSFPLIKFYHFHQNIIIDLDLKFLTPFFRKVILQLASFGILLPLCFFEDT